MGQFPKEIDTVYSGNIFGFTMHKVNNYKCAYFGPKYCPNIIPMI